MTRFALATLLTGCVAALAACTAAGNVAVSGPTPIPVPVADGSCAPSAGPVQSCVITPAPGASASASASAAASAAPAGSGLAAAPMVGEAMPDLGYLDVDGKNFQLAALKGKPLLVTAWAHWCSHCQRELPLIQTWVKANLDKGLVWVPIEGSKATPQNVKDFAAKYQIDQPLYFDPTGGIIGAIKAQGYPTERYVDKGFTIRGGSTGEFSGPGYDELLKLFP